MPINRLALIRYKTIDNCLQNRQRLWTLDDLMDACSDALYEFEGKKDGVSKRTIQLDIQNMRSEKLGYCAPIIVKDKKYYTYEEKGFSITNIPLTNNDIDTLSQISLLLKQFSGFSHFADLQDITKRLESKIHCSKTHDQPFIHFERNDNLKGIRFLDLSYSAIANKESLKIVYQSFSDSRARIIWQSPYLLKEWHNRWYIFGRNNKTGKLSVVALDRIHKLTIEPTQSFILNDLFDPVLYFKDTIGISKPNNKRKERVVFWVDKSAEPYVITKPFHTSQKLIKSDDLGSMFTIEVILNFELEKEFLSFGETLEVIEPASLRAAISSCIMKMGAFYK